MNSRQRARRRENAASVAQAWAVPDAPLGVEDVPLVDDQEVEAIRWAGYDTAMADANAHREQMLDTARDRLDRVLIQAYREYGQAVDAADQAFAAARRAAMNAHELAQATP